MTRRRELHLVLWVALALALTLVAALAAAAWAGGVHVSAWRLSRPDRDWDGWWDARGGLVRVGPGAFGVEVRVRP